MPLDLVHGYRFCTLFNFSFHIPSSLYIFRGTSKATALPPPVPKMSLVLEAFDDDDDDGGGNMNE